jgi:hypothetical protein
MPIISVKKRCGNCEHWHKTSYKRTSGECRVNPPTVVFAGCELRTKFPSTAEIDWCSNGFSHRQVANDEIEKEE